MRPVIRELLIGSLSRRAAGAPGPAAFLTLNPADKAAAITLSSGNLTATIAGSSNASVRATAGQTTGTYHFEATLLVNPGAGTCGVGVVPSTFSLTGVARFATPGGFVAINGYVNENGGGGFNADSWTTVGDTVAYEYNTATDQFWVEKVGGTGRKGPFTMGTVAGATFPLVGLATDTDSISVNLGQSAWAITPTSGFVAPT